MIDLDELMSLHAEATSGPWKVKSGEDEMMTGNKEYDVAEMLAKMCIRHECKEKTCPVGSAMDCPFYPELLCGDITSEDWILWMYAEEKK